VRWGAPLGLATGYGLGDVAVRGLPPFPPPEATQWLPLVALAAGAVGLLFALSTLPKWSRHAIAAGAIATAVVVLLRPLWQQSWTPGQSLVRLVVLCAIGLALWIGTATTLERLAPAAGWTALLALTAGTAVALGSTGSLLLGQLGGVLSAAVGVGLVVGLVRRRSIGESGALVVVTVLSGLLVAGLFYSSLPRASAATFVAAPVAAALVSTRRGARVAPLVVTAVLVAAAVTIAVIVGAPWESGY
jgi:hypothetical protein